MNLSTATHPSGDAIVARFGSIRSAAALLEHLNYRLTTDDLATDFEISVWVSDRSAKESYADTVARICKYSNALNNKVQLSTLRILQEHNIKIRFDYHFKMGVWHGTIVFKNTVSEFEIRIFIKCFKEPIPRIGG